MTTPVRTRVLAAPLAVALLVGGALIVTAPAAGAVEAGDEASFRDAWANATEITLTADITLTCANGGEADRDSDDPVVLDGAGHTIALEPGCISRVLNNDGNGATTLENVTITGGNVDNDGGGYEHDGVGPLVIRNTTFANNTACDDEAGGLSVDDAVESVLITGSTFVGNRAEFDAAIDMDEGGDFVMVNSTVTGNISNFHGAIAFESPGEGDTASIVYSTIDGNIETTDECIVTGDPPVDPDEEADAPETDDEVAPVEAGEPANLEVEEGYTLRTFATVIAEPIGNGTPTPNCSFDDGVVVESLGYNFSDDATCGFTNVAAGDREDAGSPQVGALASNGGPTQTMLPAATSPLIDGVPLDACGGGDELAGFAVTTDQRGVSRPQGPGCDIGAVEVEVVAPAPLVLEPTFTG